MTAPFARSKSAPDTYYATFKQVRAQRATADGDAVSDVDTGKSPISRWLTYALQYSDKVSNAAGSAWVLKCLIPRGSIVLDAIVRLDEAFDGTGADSVEIGDSDQASGYAAALDFTTAVTTDAVIFRDADAVYVNKASDASDGSTGPQYYPDGGVVEVEIATTVPTQGKALLFLHTISYNEDQAAEW